MIYVMTNESPVAPLPRRPTSSRAAREDARLGILSLPISSGAVRQGWRGAGHGMAAKGAMAAQRRACCDQHTMEEVD